MYEFDLKTFLNIVWERKKRIFINCGIAAVVAVIVGFSIPKEYLASASLASETQEEDGLSGGLSSLASIAGVNLKGGTDAIVPALYPDVVHSNKFLIGLLYSQVETVDGAVKTDYLTYLKEHTRKPWWNFFFRWISDLRRLISPPDDFVKGSGDGQINPYFMSREDANILENMRANIDCKVDDETLVMTVTAKAQDPLVAAMLVDSVQSHLQRFITQYHTNKARVDLKYYQGLEKKTKEDYEKAQREYADFCDTHQGSILQAYIGKQESLENELQLAYTAYSQMKQQVQIADAKVQSRTPAFTEIEGVSVPVLADSPRKSLILIAFVFLTAVGSVAWIYVKLLFSKHEKQL